MPSKSTALPAPLGGWNARDAIADMPPDHAVIMDNWFPGTDKVTLRQGSTEHATGMSGAVNTILPYTPLNGTAKQFSANGSSIYDTTSAGAVGAAVVTGMTSDKYQIVQMGTSGGNFLLAFNGVDTPKTYDGSSWANASITGPTAASLIWGNPHQTRLWVGEKDSLDAWYLGVNSISGAATKFPLAGIASLGGHIMAMGTWSRDAGDGQDDVAVFLTSEGQAIVYSGTDPSAASTWSLIGVFRIGKPVGRRCMMKAGPDLVMVTEDGFVTAASILALDRSQSRKGALSDQINQAVNTSVRAGGSLFGWEPILYPRGTMMLFNVPQTATTAHQYVFNTITGAPARFTGMNATCWALVNDDLYLGGHNGKTFKFDFGNSDDGANINGDALQAFNYFGSSQTNKAFKMVEPIFESAGDPNAALDLYTDFTITTPSGASSATVVNAAIWGTSLWGTGEWGTDGQIYRGWRGVRGIGRSAALRVRVQTATSRPSWVATNFLYTPGGMV